MARDDFDDSDQLRIGNDGIFMLTFFSKYVFKKSIELLISKLYFPSSSTCRKLS